MPIQSSESKIVRSQALAGVRIADFTQALAGPACTKILADYGAEVIKIESNRRLDLSRATTPFKDDDAKLEKSIPFCMINTGKLSITLNLTHPKGVQIVKDLVSKSDAVVENFRPGAMARMGLGYQELKKVKPDIIMVSVSFPGQGSAKYANAAGFGPMASSIAGAYAVCGWPDREPTSFAGVGIGDNVTPLFSVTAILAGLEYRERTGKGTYFDVNQFEVLTSFMMPYLLEYGVNKRAHQRDGNRHPNAAPHGAFRCKGNDRWCAIAVFTEEEWKGFCHVIGNPDWTKEPRFASLSSRKENEDELEHLVEDWTIRYPAQEVMEMMQKAGVSAGIVQDISDMMETDPQLRERGFWTSVDHPVIGCGRYPGVPGILSRTPHVMSRAPLFGEHNQHVLEGLLGIPEDEIGNLIADGVIQ